MIVKPIEVSGWLEQRRLASKTMAKRYGFLGIEATHLRLFETSSMVCDTFSWICHDVVGV
jgi:hypothetical protein